jgi:hypothetical protein
MFSSLTGRPCNMAPTTKKFKLAGNVCLFFEIHMWDFELRYGFELM